MEINFGAIECSLEVGWTVIPLIRDPQRLSAMGSAASGYGRRDGDEALLDFVCEAVAAR